MNQRERNDLDNYITGHYGEDQFRYEESRMSKPLWIVVPSRERADWLMGRTNHTLKYLQQFKPTLYVREDDSQFELYKKYAEQYNAIFLKQSPEALGAAQTYDSLINMAILMDYERLIIIDDDLFFSHANTVAGAKPDFVKCDDEMMVEFIKSFSYITCPELPAASVCPIMKRTQRHWITFNQPLMWAYSYYIPHFAEHPEHRFWSGRHIEARCDLNLTLKILTDGYMTAHLASFFIPDNVNNPGGCSTYRSIELERASVEYLKKTYPNVVTTRLKKGWIESPDIIREAPFIQWKKAFNKAAFKNHFGVDANKFARELLDNYEHDFNKFLFWYREMHDASNRA